MDNEFFKYLTTLGVGGVLAGLMFFFYRKDVQQYTELWRSSTSTLIQVVQDNTKSNVQMVSLLDAMHRRMDADDARRD